MARCGQCLDDGFLMPFDVALDDQRFGTLEQRVDAGDAQDADILARIAAFVRRAVAEARGAAVRGVRRDRGDTGLKRDGGMDRLNLCLEPVERDIVAQQRKGRRDRLEGDDARTLRVARREQAVESLIGADIDESEGAVLRREETGQIAAIRSAAHTSELQSLIRISYAVFCLKKKKY